MWLSIQNPPQSEPKRSMGSSPKFGSWVRTGLTERNLGQNDWYHLREGESHCQIGPIIKNTWESGQADERLEMDAWVNSKIGPPGGNTKRQSFEGSVKCSDDMSGIQGQAQIESEKGKCCNALVVHGNARFYETQTSLYIYISVRGPEERDSLSSWTRMSLRQH